MGYLQRGAGVQQRGCAAEGEAVWGKRSTTAGWLCSWQTHNLARQAALPTTHSTHHFLIPGAIEMPMPVPMAMGPPTEIACEQVLGVP